MKCLIFSIATVCLLAISGAASLQFRASRSEVIDQSFIVDGVERAQKQYKIDPNRIYAIGHSNGARFATALWKTPGEKKFAAFCSAAAQSGLMVRDATPRSLFAIAGENDRIVRYDWQMMGIEV